MKSISMVLIASAGLFLSGCAATTSAGSRNNAPRAPASPATVSAAAPGMIGVGTSLVVRTREAISTARDVPGKTYSAEVIDDIVDQGSSMLVPKGSRVQLTAVASTGGTSATPELQLAVLSMTVNGKTYQVNAIAEGGSNPEGGGQKRLRAKKADGPALLGSATVGGAGGEVAQATTRGKEVRLPAETVITFRLEQPIQLQGYTP